MKVAADAKAVANLRRSSCLNEKGSHVWQRQQRQQWHRQTRQVRAQPLLHVRHLRRRGLGSPRSPLTSESQTTARQRGQQQRRRRRRRRAQTRTLAAEAETGTEIALLLVRALVRPPQPVLPPPPQWPPRWLRAGWPTMPPPARRSFGRLVQAWAPPLLRRRHCLRSLLLLGLYWPALAGEAPRPLHAAPPAAVRSAPPPPPTPARRWLHRPRLVCGEWACSYSRGAESGD